MDSCFLLFVEEEALPQPVKARSTEMARDDNQDGIKEAKEILKAQGASYKNLTFDSDSTVGKYAGNIMAFPTTVLVSDAAISFSSFAISSSMPRIVSMSLLSL